MIDRGTMDRVTKAAVTLPDQIAGMRTDLAAQTAMMKQFTEAVAKQGARIQEPPIFLDLTLAQPTVQIGDTLNIVHGFLSAAGPQQFVVHIGEAGEWFRHWYTGGLDVLIPLRKEYPLPLNRGVRIWIEQVNRPDVDFFIKLVAYPVRSPHAEG